MSQIRIIFDPERYRQLRLSVPPLKFTCSEITLESLPEYLKLCYMFLEILFKFAKEDDCTSFLNYKDHRDLSSESKSFIIKNPMDFSILKDKIISSSYNNIYGFKRDVDLIWDNAFQLFKKSDKEYNEAFQLKNRFNDLWDRHITIKDPKTLAECLTKLNDGVPLLDNGLLSLKKLFEFPDPERRTISKPQKQQIKDVKTTGPTYLAPTSEQMNQIMTHTEKYTLAQKINKLPIELLGEVINILEKEGYLKGEKITIQFSDIPNAILRKIEFYVISAEEKEKSVRSMYSEQIPATEQRDKITAKIDEIGNMLAAKNLKETSSDMSEFSGSNTESDNGNYSD